MRHTTRTFVTTLAAATLLSVASAPAHAGTYRYTDPHGDAVGSGSSLVRDSADILHTTWTFDHRAGTFKGLVDTLNMDPDTYVNLQVNGRVFLTSSGGGNLSTSISIDVYRTPTGVLRGSATVGGTRASITPGFSTISDAIGFDLSHPRLRDAHQVDVQVRVGAEKPRSGSYVDTLGRTVGVR